MNNFSTTGDIIHPINLFETQQIDENLCAICLDELGTVNTHTLENCNHTFHSACLIHNLQYGNLSCPMCRNISIGNDDRANYYRGYQKNLKIYLDYSKRKNADKRVVKMVEKYKKINKEHRDAKKKSVEFRKFFNNKHKIDIKTRNKLSSDVWRIRKKLRKISEQIMTVPILPIIIPVKKRRIQNQI